jgi:hypothetical protein
MERKLSTAAGNQKVTISDKVLVAQLQNDPFSVAAEAAGAVMRKPGESVQDMAKAAAKKAWPFVDAKPTAAKVKPSRNGLPW